MSIWKGVQYHYSCWKYELKSKEISICLGMDIIKGTDKIPSTDNYVDRSNHSLGKPSVDFLLCLNSNPEFDPRLNLHFLASLTSSHIGLPHSPFGSLADLLFSNMLSFFLPEVHGTSCFLCLELSSLRIFQGSLFFVSSSQLSVIFGSFT